MPRRLVPVLICLGIAGLVVLGLLQRSAVPHATGGSPASVAADAPKSGAAVAVDRPDALPPPDRERDLHGTVVTPDGKPIAGARVRALEYPQKRMYASDFHEWASREIAAGVTEESGEFRLRLRPGQVVTLRADAAGFAAREIPGCLAGARVRVELSTGARVIAVVTSKSGTAIEGALVELESLEAGQDERHLQRKLTDAKGEAAFEPVPAPGYANVDVWHHSDGAGFKATELTSDGDARVEVELNPTMTVRGRVTEAKSGAPVAGARVKQDRFPHESTLTDADGRYSLSGVHRPRTPDPDSRETECLNGRGGLVAEAKGFRPENNYPDADGITDFELGPAARIIGRVVDAAGKPVAGASAVAAQEMVSPDDYCTTGADGRFSIEELYASSVYLLLVNADGFGLVALEFEAPAEGESRDVGDIQLALPCMVAGRVVSPSGESVAGIHVILEGSPANRGRLRPGQPTETEPREGIRADDLGRFSFPGLSPGDFKVTAYGDCGAAEASVHVADGSRADVELHLPAIIRFRAVVVDEAGAPQVGVTVEASYNANAHGNGGTATRGVTDTGGGLTFQVGTKRPYVRVHSGPAGWDFVAPEAVPVPPGAAEVKIVVHPGLRTGGTVVDEAGAPVAGAQVEAWRGDDSVGRVFANDAGEFSLLLTDGTPVDLVLTGEVLITENYHRESQLLEGALRGARPGDTRLRIPAVRPPRDTTLSLRIVGPGNVPAAGCTVQLRGPTVDEDREPGPDGCVTFTEMPRVELRLTVYPADGSGLCWWAGRVTPAGQEFRVELARELRFTGNVLQPDGAPANNYRVEVRTGTRVLDWTQSEPDGGFVLTIPEGTTGPFNLFAWDPNTDLIGRVESVQAGGDPVVVRLAPGE